jgi:hypothetical protein
MKIDWSQLEAGIQKQAGIREGIGSAWRGLRDGVAGLPNQIAGAGQAAATNLTNMIPGVESARYLSGGGLMQDLGNVAMSALPLALRFGKKPNAGGGSTFALGKPNLLNSAPNEVRSLGAVNPNGQTFKLAEKLAGMLGSANKLHLEKIRLRQAIQNAKVYGKTPNNMQPITELLRNRNTRFKTPTPPIPNVDVKAAGLILHPAMLRSALINRTANGVLDRMHQPQSSSKLENVRVALESQHPDIKKMLAEPEAKNYLERLLTETDPNSYTDEKDIYTRT